MTQRSLFSRVSRFPWPIITQLMAAFGVAASSFPPQAE
jgi:hypothetical protein